jgi:hypothetical protein
MPGGLLQLYSYGLQDEIFIKDPQITFFKTVYRKHTNFSIDTINTIHNIKFNTNTEIPLSKTGDLLYKLIVKLEFPTVKAYYNESLDTLMNSINTDDIYQYSNDIHRINTTIFKESIKLLNDVLKGNFNNYLNDYNWFSLDDLEYQQKYIDLIKLKLKIISYYQYNTDKYIDFLISDRVNYLIHNQVIIPTVSSTNSNQISTNILKQYYMITKYGYDNIDKLLNGPKVSGSIQIDSNDIPSYLVFVSDKKDILLPVIIDSYSISDSILNYKGHIYETIYYDYIIKYISTSITASSAPWYLRFNNDFRNFKIKSITLSEKYEIKIYESFDILNLDLSDYIIIMSNLNYNSTIVPLLILSIYSIDASNNIIRCKKSVSNDFDIKNLKILSPYKPIYNNSSIFNILSSDTDYKNEIKYCIKNSIDITNAIMNVMTYPNYINKIFESLYQPYQIVHKLCINKDDYSMFLDQKFNKSYYDSYLLSMTKNMNKNSLLYDKIKTSVTKYHNSIINSFQYIYNDSNIKEVINEIINFTVISSKLRDKIDINNIPFKRQLDYNSIVCLVFDNEVVEDKILYVDNIKLIPLYDKFQKILKLRLLPYNNIFTIQQMDYIKIGNNFDVNKLVSYNGNQYILKYQYSIINIFEINNNFIDIYVRTSYIITKDDQTIDTNINELLFIKQIFSYIPTSLDTIYNVITDDPNILYELRYQELSQNAFYYLKEYYISNSLSNFRLENIWQIVFTYQDKYCIYDIISFPNYYYNKYNLSYNYGYSDLMNMDIHFYNIFIQMLYTGYKKILMINNDNLSNVISLMIQQYGFILSQEYIDKNNSVFDQKNGYIDLINALPNNMILSIDQIYNTSFEIIKLLDNHFINNLKYKLLLNKQSLLEILNTIPSFNTEEKFINPEKTIEFFNEDYSYNNVKNVLDTLSQGLPFYLSSDSNSYNVLNSASYDNIINGIPLVNNFDIDYNDIQKDELIDKYKNLSKFNIKKANYDLFSIFKTKLQLPIQTYFKTYLLIILDSYLVYNWTSKNTIYEIIINSIIDYNNYQEIYNIYKSLIDTYLINDFEFINLIKYTIDIYDNSYQYNLKLEYIHKNYEIRKYLIEYLRDNLKISDETNYQIIYEYIITNLILYTEFSNIKQICYDLYTSTSNDQTYKLGYQKYLQIISKIDEIELQYKYKLYDKTFYCNLLVQSTILNDDQIKYIKNNLVYYVSDSDLLSNLNDIYIHIKGNYSNNYNEIFDSIKTTLINYLTKQKDDQTYFLNNIKKLVKDIKNDDSGIIANTYYNHFENLDVSLFTISNIENEYDNLNQLYGYFNVSENNLLKNETERLFNSVYRINISLDDDIMSFKQGKEILHELSLKYINQTINIIGTNINIINNRFINEIKDYGNKLSCKSVLNTINKYVSNYFKIYFKRSGIFDEVILSELHEASIDNIIKLFEENITNYIDFNNNINNQIINSLNILKNGKIINENIYQRILRDIIYVNSNIDIIIDDNMINNNDYLYKSETLSYYDAVQIMSNLLMTTLNKNHFKYSIGFSDQINLIGNLTIVSFLDDRYYIHYLNDNENIRYRGYIIVQQFDNTYNYTKVIIFDEIKLLIYSFDYEFDTNILIADNSNININVPFSKITITHFINDKFTLDTKYDLISSEQIMNLCNDNLTVYDLTISLNNLLYSTILSHKTVFDIMNKISIFNYDDIFDTIKDKTIKNVYIYDKIPYNQIKDNSNIISSFINSKLYLANIADSKLVLKIIDLITSSKITSNSTIASLLLKLCNNMAISSIEQIIKKLDILDGSNNLQNVEIDINIVNYNQLSYYDKMYYLYNYLIENLDDKYDIPSINGNLYDIEYNITNMFKNLKSLIEYYSIINNDELNEIGILFNEYIKYYFYYNINDDYKIIGSLLQYIYNKLSNNDVYVYNPVTNIIHKNLNIIFILLINISNYYNFSNLFKNSYSNIDDKLYLIIDDKTNDNLKDNDKYQTVIIPSPNSNSYTITNKKIIKLVRGTIEYNLRNSIYANFINVILEQQEAFNEMYDTILNLDNMCESIDHKNIFSHINNFDWVTYKNRRKSLTEYQINSNIVLKSYLTYIEPLTSTKMNSDFFNGLTSFNRDKLIEFNNNYDSYNLDYLNNSSSDTTNSFPFSDNNLFNRLKLSNILRKSYNDISYGLKIGNFFVNSLMEINSKLQVDIMMKNIDIRDKIDDCINSYNILSSDERRLIYQLYQNQYKINGILIKSFISNINSNSNSNSNPLQTIFNIDGITYVYEDILMEAAEHRQIFDDILSYDFKQKSIGILIFNKSDGSKYDYQKIPNFRLNSNQSETDYTFKLYRKTDLPDGYRYIFDDNMKIVKVDLIELNATLYSELSNLDKNIVSNIKLNGQKELYYEFDNMVYTNSDYQYDSSINKIKVNKLLDENCKYLICDQYVFYIKTIINYANQITINFPYELMIKDDFVKMIIYNGNQYTNEDFYIINDNGYARIRFINNDYFIINRLYDENTKIKLYLDNQNDLYNTDTFIIQNDQLQIDIKINNIGGEYYSLIDLINNQNIDLSLLNGNIRLGVFNLLQYDNYDNHIIQDVLNSFNFNKLYIVDEIYDSNIYLFNIREVLNSLNSSDEINKIITNLDNYQELENKNVSNRLDLSKRVNKYVNRNSEAQFSYIPYLADFVFSHVKLKIDGTIIDEISNAYQYIHHNFLNNVSKRFGYNKMNHNNEQLLLESSVKKTFTLYIEIPLYFNKTSVLSLPLIATLYSKMLLKFKIRSLEDLTIKDETVSLKFNDNIKMSLIYSIIYLDDFERKTFASKRLEYLIENRKYNCSIQLQKTVLHNKFNIGCESLVKDFFYYIQLDSMIKAKQYYNFTYDYLLPELFMETKDKIKYLIQNVNNGYSDSDIIELYDKIIKRANNKIVKFMNNMKDSDYIYIEQLFDAYYEKKLNFNSINLTNLYFNSVESITVAGDMSSKIVSYQHYNNMIPGLNIINFSLFPLEYQPSGHANFFLLMPKIKLTLNESIKKINDNDIITCNLITRNYTVLRFISGICGLSW